MKKMTLKEFAEHVQTSVDAAQQEHILIIRDAVPIGVLLGIENKDEEDWRLEISSEFWRMIEKSRKEATVPLEQVEAELFGGKDLSCRYSMLIQWSDEDQVYVVTLPEFEAKTHGSTYEEAAKSGRKALESLIESYLEEAKALPEPVKLGSPLPV
jgi:antitoxin HicB